MHVGSSSLTRDQTQGPCIGSVETYPLEMTYAILEKIQELRGIAQV